MLTAQDIKDALECAEYERCRQDGEHCTKHIDWEHAAKYLNDLQEQRASEATWEAGLQMLKVLDEPF